MFKSIDTRIVMFGVSLDSNFIISKSIIIKIITIVLHFIFFDNGTFLKIDLNKIFYRWT